MYQIILIQGYVFNTNKNDVNKSRDFADTQ